MGSDGRVPDGTGLSQAEPAGGLVPAGFDPSRVGSIIASKQRALTTAATATKALGWLLQYGKTIIDEPKGNVRILVQPLFAGSCSGREEAEAYLRDAAMIMVLDIFECAAAAAKKDVDQGLAALEAQGTEAREGGDAVASLHHLRPSGALAALVSKGLAERRYHLEKRPTEYALAPRGLEVKALLERSQHDR